MDSDAHLNSNRVVHQEKMYRDKKSGRFIAKRDIHKNQKIEIKKGGKAKDSTKPKQPMKEIIIGVMQEQGIDANTVEEVWGHLVGVQAEIAMDKSNGSKATAAAKLVAQVMGTMDEDSSKGDATEVLVLGRGLAGEVLALIEEIKRDKI